MVEYFKVKFEPYHCFHCHLLVRTLKEHTWHEDSYPGPGCNSDPRNKLSAEEESVELVKNFQTLMRFEAMLDDSLVDNFEDSVFYADEDF